jgi:LysM repeat protein
MRTRSALLALALVVTLGIPLALVAAVPVAAAQGCPPGPWWCAEFFEARWPTARPVFTRLDPDINFNWGTGSPDVAVPVDNFSARWTRTLDFEGGLFRFWALHDDGVTLWIDDQLIINQWYDQPAFAAGADGEPVPVIHETTVSVSTGAHTLRVEYYEHGKNAVIQVGWTQVPPDLEGYVPPPGTLVPRTIHLVRPGEWLMKIGRAYQVSVETIVAANNLSSMQLVPGQRLIIPAIAAGTNPSTGSTMECRTIYTVKTGDNLFRIARNFNTTVGTLAARNGLTAPYIIHVGQRLCIP